MQFYLVIIFIKRLCKRAKDVAVSAIRNGGEYLKATESYYFASDSYSMLGKCDSAQYYINIFPKIIKTS
jgi:hypothetical protein